MLAPGTVVVIEFRGAHQSKRRPVVVVSTDLYHAESARHDFRGDYPNRFKTLRPQPITFFKIVKQRAFTCPPRFGRLLKPILRPPFSRKLVI
jgi:hypothetical protein